MSGEVFVSQTDFFAAARSGNLAEVSRLAEQDPTLLRAKDERGASALLTACYSGQKEVRDFLLSKTPQVELHEAAAAGQLSRVKELVEADPAAAKGYSPDGFPIMALAAVFGHEAVARYLLGKGADVNLAATNGSGYTALTGAVTNGHTSLSTWLAENGANVNYRYANGFSPLLAAAANGHLEIVRMLLERGADLHARAGDGRNALAFAEDRKHSEVADYLRSRGLTL